MQKGGAIKKEWKPKIKNSDLPIPVSTETVEWLSHIHLVKNLTMSELVSECINECVHP